MDLNANDDVGVELEFPIARFDAPGVDVSALRGLFRALAQIGYATLTESASGMPLRVKDGAGNVVTFDTSYAIMEFAMMHAPSLVGIYRRFRDTLEFTQRYLTARGHALLGLGYREIPKGEEPPMVDCEITLTIQKFLSADAVPAHGHSRATHLDFYKNIASEQVHFNAKTAELPRLFDAFSYIDFATVLLFANSPGDVLGRRRNCARMPLYYESRFREMGLVGSQGIHFKTLDDIVEAYKRCCLYSRHRDGRVELFSPVPLDVYFSDPAYGARAEDMSDFDPVRHIITTPYGTCEYRAACAQPLGEAFAPAAFLLGLRQRLDDVIALAGDFYRAHGFDDPDALVLWASDAGELPGVSDEELEVFLRALADVSLRGLRARGYGEEALLAPLFARACLSDSPARAYWADEAIHGSAQAARARAGIGHSLL